MRRLLPLLLLLPAWAGGQISVSDGLCQAPVDGQIYEWPCSPAVTPPPRELTFTASPNPATPGQKVSFAWQGFGNDCTMNSAERRTRVRASDSMTVVLPRTATITFACGDQSTSLTVEVTDSRRPLPAPASLPPGPLAHIPEIPFDYAQEPGTPTRSGPLPASLGAGDVLALDDYTVNGDMTFSCSGTEAKPAFIIGGAIHNDGQVLRVTGSWCIFVDTVFDNVQPRTSGDHIIFRGVDVGNHSRKNCTGLGGNNIVLVDSEIHHCQGNDRHGIHVSSGAENIWILRNHVHHNGGDGFQACHRCSADPPRNVYIGDNLFHSDRENGIDFKYIENVIVEGNTLHSYVNADPDKEWCFDDGTGCSVFSSGSDGSAIAIGTDGGPTNVRVINNEVYDSVKAVRIEEGVNIDIENNNLHDVEWCLQLAKNGYDTVFAGNTCENAVRGIFQNWRDQFSLAVDGNTFRNITAPAIEYEARSVGQASTLNGNLFSNTGAVIYGNTVASTESDINALPGARDNVVE